MFSTNLVNTFLYIFLCRTALELNSKNFVNFQNLWKCCGNLLNIFRCILWHRERGALNELLCTNVKCINWLDFTFTHRCSIWTPLCISLRFFFFTWVHLIWFFFLLKSLQFNGIPVPHPPLHFNSTQLHYSQLLCLVAAGTWDKCNARLEKETTEEKINLTNFCLRQNSLSHATIHPTYFLNKWVAVWKQPTKISAFTSPYPDIHVHMSGLDIATGITAAGV